MKELYCLSRWVPYFQPVYIKHSRWITANRLAIELIPQILLFSIVICNIFVSTINTQLIYDPVDTYSSSLIVSQFYITFSNSRMACIHSNSGFLWTLLHAIRSAYQDFCHGIWTHCLQPHNQKNHVVLIDWFRPTVRAVNICTISRRIWEKAVCMV